MPEERPVGFVVPQPAADEKPSPADGLVACGAVLATVAIGGLAGAWWALLFLGLFLIAGGVLRGWLE